MKTRQNGAGIDIGTGLTLKAVRRAKVITHHPDTRQPVAGIAVPDWEKMLLMAAAALEVFATPELRVAWARKRFTVKSSAAI